MSNNVISFYSRTNNRPISVASEEVDLIQLQAQAENALCMALYYLRQPAGNFPDATRKTVQALNALRELNGFSNSCEYETLDQNKLLKSEVST